MMNVPIITSPTQLVFEVPENFPLLTKIPGTDITGYDPDGNEIIACSVAVLDGLGNKEGVSIGDAYLEGGSCYLEFGEEAVIDYESDVKQYRTLVAIYEKDYLGQSNPVIFTINITDVNEAPTITSTTTTFSAAENQTVIPGATITAIDVDAGDTLTFSVLSDVLTIDPDTGVLSFATAPDFETTTEAITATVTVTDAAGLFDTQEVTVTVTDVNDNAPVFTAGATLAVNFAENSTDPVTTLAATDLDAGDTVTYTLKDELDAGSFNLADGVLTFKTAPDFETKSSYSITAVASDGVNEVNQAITVTVNNLNDERPIITSPTQFVFEVPENFPLQTKIPGIDITGYDPDGNKLRSCQQSNPDGLTPNTGLMVASQLPMSATQTCDLLFGSQANTDYESGPKSFKIEVAILDKNNPVTGRTGNNNVSDTQLITVNITDVNDNPPVFADVNYDITIVENTKGPTLLETTDADTGSTVTYSLSGADAADFEIVNNTLALKEAADFETKSSYAVTVTATDNDGVNSTDQAVTYTITDANDNAPRFELLGSEIEIEENTSDVITLTTTDLDTTNDTVEYSVIGADSSYFTITPVGGLFITPVDFETGITRYDITVTASDGINSTDKPLTVIITDANDNAPVFAEVNYDITIVENTKGPTLLETTDADAGSTVTYSLSGADAADFEIVNNTLALKQDADFETKTSYAVTVTASDGVNSTTQAVTYTITDANDNAPVFADVNYDITIVENTKGPTLLETTDADAGSTVTYSLSGADAADFEIVNNTLALKEAADFETKTSYAVTVTAR